MEKGLKKVGVEAEDAGPCGAAETPPDPLSPLRPVREGWGKPDGGRERGGLLIKGDNLKVLGVLRDLKDGCSPQEGSPFSPRLVYLDPPFATGYDFNFKGDSGRRAYSDKRKGREFLGFMEERLKLLYDLMACDGTIMVHIDWKMSHYVKVLMDDIFGSGNLLNEIIWHYGGRGAKAVSRQLPKNHDTILWYKKGKDFTYNKVFTEHRVKKGTPPFRVDDEGRWFKTAPRGDYTDRSIEALSKEGRIHITKGGKERIKYFIREEGDYLVEEKLVGDVWSDIPDCMHIPRSERTGYPTQKPEALLERIIRLASNPGELVLDAFAGSGTTLVAADKLGRRWIGIDSGTGAIDTALSRLERRGAANSGGEEGSPRVARDGGEDGSLEGSGEGPCEGSGAAGKVPFSLYSL